MQTEYVDPCDADRVQRRELTHVGSKRRNIFAAGKLDRKPHGSNVNYRRALNVKYPKTIRDRSDMQWSRLAELRLGQREEQPFTVKLDVDEAFATLWTNRSAALGLRA
jgi:hypothetical protein